jgi:hypothetical protein
MLLSAEQIQTIVETLNLRNSKEYQIAVGEIVSDGAGSAV